jgi:hypothetical protein
LDTVYNLKLVCHFISSVVLCSIIINHINLDSLNTLLILKSILGIWLLSYLIAVDKNYTSLK